jgi:flagellar basal body P-ring protein FlgI
MSFSFRHLHCARWIAGALVGLVLIGCGNEPAPKVTARYSTLPLRDVPDYLKDSIMQYADLGGTEPYPVSGYALVANLDGTGSSRAPTPVRDYIMKQMSIHGFGSIGSGLGSPEDVLNDKNFAIVQVEGLLPPGARAGPDWWTWFDVRVSALPQSDTTSLAHGDLYDTPLKVSGANPLEPSERVEVKAQARGPIFVNPAYALDDTIDTTAARASRREGVVIGGARPLSNRPLTLRLRAPERRLARAIERRINEQFQAIMDIDLPVKGTTNYIADAQDEGIVTVLIPRAYSGNWKHFASLLKVIYMQGGSPTFAAIKAQQLADEAVKPGAYLEEISYAWEGLGKASLHAITPLMTSGQPDVQFAAVRAAAFIGDPAAPHMLLAIAKTPKNSFRVNAVKTLGELPPSPLVDRMVRDLLDSDQALVRIEAYKVLAAHKDRAAIFTRVVKKGDVEKFALDIVPGNAAPLVYATRQEIPRLAVFGNQTSLDMPAMFIAMNNRLTISSNQQDGLVTIFYRGRKAVHVESSPDLAEIAARLGGEGPPGNNGLDFSYGDVVAVVQSLMDQQKVSGLQGSQRQIATFVLQEPTRFEDLIDSAPLLHDTGRPQTDQPAAPDSAEQKPAQVGADVGGMSAPDAK